MVAGGIHVTRATAGGLGGAGRTARDSTGGIGGSREPCRARPVRRIRASLCTAGDTQARTAVLEVGGRIEDITR